MARPLEYNATLVERVDLTDALSIFLILPDRLPARPWFAAGQYCVLGLNNMDDTALGSVRRSMSIASPPEDDGPIEFYIRRVARPESKNPLTHLLWSLQPGDRIYLRTVAAGVFGTGARSAVRWKTRSGWAMWVELKRSSNSLAFVISKGA